MEKITFSLALVRWQARSRSSSHSLTCESLGLPHRRLLVACCSDPLNVLKSAPQACIAIDHVWLAGEAVRPSWRPPAVSEDSGGNRLGSIPGLDALTYMPPRSILKTLGLILAHSRRRHPRLRSQPLTPAGWTRRCRTDAVVKRISSWTAP